MNMTSLEQLHQRKRDDEPDRGPFEASQNGVKHFGPTVAQATAVLKRTGASAGFKFLARPKPAIADVIGCEVAVIWPFFCAENGFVRWKCVDCNPAVCLRSPP